LRANGIALLLLPTMFSFRCKSTRALQRRIAVFQEPGLLRKRMLFPLRPIENLGLRLLRWSVG